MELKVKEFATFTDPLEKVSYTGQVVGLTAKEITFDARVDFAKDIVTMTFPRSEENMFTPARRPKGWEDRTVESTPKKKSKKKSATKTKSSKSTSPTKRELVEKLVLDNPKLTRKEHIDLAVKELGMTPAGASTYVSGARKLLP